ncbi:SDR family NAD(P)-dependent oxidoreductase [Leifsonia sp. NPDC056665]|uniref:SDR family NAD(P)-dependent oxidoreductase n=1 Tax=Leifsonia sp. NPDC056665 TaxID=3345901 RepID=UPI0036B4F257
MTSNEYRTAIVTGAATGQGLATARALHTAGYHVVLVDITTDVETSASSVGEHATGIQADISDEAGWVSVLRHIADTSGKLDLLVNNAGIYRRGAVESMPLDDVDLLYRVNQRAVILGVRASLQYLVRSPGSSIVNISSTAGITGDAEIVAYSGTKWAVRGITKSLAAELAPRGIRVNCVIPGLVATAMADANGDAVNDNIIDRTFLHRIGEPDEVASATLFLASSGASYITGAEIVVDGGLSV